MRKNKRVPKRKQQVNLHSLKKYMSTPKGTLMVILLLLSVSNFLASGSLTGIFHILIAIVFAVFIDAIVAIWRAYPRKFSDGACISGWIIGLILGVQESIWIIFATVILAMVSKHLLSHGRKPVFNPAAFALLLAVWFWGAQESWWGAFSVQSSWWMIILIITGFWMTNRVRKFPQVLSFLATFFSGMLILAIFHWGSVSFTPADALRPPFINMTLFFTFFMLTDPPTTPGRKKLQIVFGCLSATLSILSMSLWGGQIYLLLALCSANTIKFLFDRIQKRRKNHVFPTKSLGLSE